MQATRLDLFCWVGYTCFLIERLLKKFYLKGKSIMVQSTFQSRVLGCRNRYYENHNKAFAFVVREALHNADAQGAQNMAIFNIKYERDTFLCICHDGKPFKDIQNLMECLEPCKSDGEGGIQGSGMKSSMFLLSPEKSKLVVHSHSSNNNGFSAQLTIKSFDSGKVEAVIKDVSDKYGESIKKILGKHYGDYHVYYLYKCIKQSKDRQKPNSYISSASVRLASELTPSLFEKINIKVIFNEMLSTSLNFAKANKMPYLKPDELKRMYAVNREDHFEANFKLVIRGKQVNFRGIMDVEIYPNLIKRPARPLIINKINRKDSKDRVAKSGTPDHISQSKEQVFVTFVFNKHPSRQNIEPYYTRSHSRGIMNDLNIFYPEKIPNERIEEYHGALLKREKVSVSQVSWSPVIKVHFTIILDEEAKEHYPTDFGDIDEFFHATNDEIVKKMIKSLCLEISKQKENLKNLRDYISLNFPGDLSDRACPLVPKIPRKNIIDIIDSDGNVIKLLEPGQNLPLVRLRSPKGYIKQISHVTEGIEIKHVQGDEFRVIVSPLLQKKDGKVQKVNEKDYDKSCIPKKKCSCTVGGEQYRFSFEVNTPPCPKPIRPTPIVPVPINKRQVKPIEIDEYDNNTCKEMDPEELFGVLNSDGGKLILNTKNKTINSLTSFSPLSHGDLFKELQKTYELALGIARKARDAWNVLDVRFKNDSESKDAIKGFEDEEERYFVNTFLDIVFTSEDTEKLIAKINSRKEEAAEEAKENESDIAQENANFTNRNGRYTNGNGKHRIPQDEEIEEYDFECAKP